MTHRQLQDPGVRGVQSASCTGCLELAIERWRTSKYTFAHLGHGVIGNRIDALRIGLAAHRFDEFVIPRLDRAGTFGIGAEGAKRLDLHRAEQRKQRRRVMEHLLGSLDTRECQVRPARRERADRVRQLDSKHGEGCFEGLEHADEHMLVVDDVNGQHREAQGVALLA